jgi:hypothetical protein
VPYVQVGIDILVHSATDNNLFSHNNIKFRLRNRVAVWFRLPE